MLTADHLRNQSDAINETVVVLSVVLSAPQSTNDIDKGNTDCTHSLAGVQRVRTDSLGDADRCAQYQFLIILLSGQG